MRWYFLLFFLSILFLNSGCHNDKQPAVSKDILVEPGPKPTGPSEGNTPARSLDSDPPEALNSKTLTGTWILENYKLDNYIHLKNLNKKQKANFEIIVGGLIGKRKFIFFENGEFESYNASTSHNTGKWFIGENGVNLNLEHEFEVLENSKKAFSKTNIYTINKFTKNYLTLSDVDQLTFIFKKSK